jgi:hypothetical protein
MPIQSTTVYRYVPSLELGLENRLSTTAYSVGRLVGKWKAGMWVRKRKGRQAWCWLVLWVSDAGSSTTHQPAIRQFAHTWGPGSSPLPHTRQVMHFFKFHCFGSGLLLVESKSLGFFYRARFSLSNYEKNLTNLGGECMLKYRMPKQPVVSRKIFGNMRDLYNSFSRVLNSF